MAKKTDSAIAPMEDDKYSEWRVRDALDTIIKSQEVMCDEKMMKKVKALAKQKKKEFSSINDIIKYRNESAMEKDEDGDDD